MTATIQLGESPLEISRVVFGAWAIGGWFWGGTDDDDAIAAIHAALDAGITAVDTAPMYGCGHSEEVVGRALRGRREGVVLMTKVGLRWDDPRGSHFFDTTNAAGDPISVYRNLRPDSVKLEVERSLRRLGVDHIDLIQCHWPDPSTPVEETMGALAALHAAGKVGAIGVSNFDRPLLERSQAALGALPLASNQPPYSLLKRDIEAEVLPWCRRNGVGTIVYSPMERGLLSGKMSPGRVLGEGDGRAKHPWFSVENRRRVGEALERAEELARAHGCSIAQLVVAWTLHQQGVSAALVGARTPEQARHNAGAMDVRLEADEVALLSRLFEELELEG